MSKRTVVVGLNIGHDGGAAIAIDGKIACAISEERLNRRRYSYGYLNSFFYCLSTAGIVIKDISLIVFSSYGESLPSHYQGELKRLGLPSSRFMTVNHHLSHAYGSFFLSPFDDALVVVMDGEGNNAETESYYIAEGQRIEKIGGNTSKRNPAKGIGRTYEAFTNFLGWTDQDAGKTMGLAAYGNSSRIKKDLFSINNSLEVIGALDYKYEKGVIDFMKMHKLPFGQPFGKGKNKESVIAASYAQRTTESVVIELITRLVEKTGKKKLCMSGGVALNCVINEKLIRKHIVDDIFILPASSDRGQPIGNALYGFQKLTGYLPKNSLRNDYFGKIYTEKDILSALNRNKRAFVIKNVPRKEIIYEKQKNISKTTSALLKEGKIIGWFQGESEFGPRALGHRSILCDSRKIEIKDKLNNRIKHREPFRPFAPSCLLGSSRDYFEFSKASPFMLFSPQVKQNMKSKIPAVTHIDGTARLQTVTKRENGIYHDLIDEFYKLTGVPIILNTSFNNQEPIVETPGDAVGTFLSTEIDYLAIGDYLAWKKR